MIKFKHIVEIFLWDRPNWIMSEEYLRDRLEFFEKYTLPSLLNQFDQNFEIFLQLGNKHKKITEEYHWHPKVTPCYDFGKAEYNKIKADFLIISRLDSDDMFHRNAIGLIKVETEKMVSAKSCFYRKNRLVLVFKDNVCWDMTNECLIKHKKSTSPFFTHVYPELLYTKWDLFKRTHFRTHGDSGTGDRDGYELPTGYVCITKHGQNVSHLKRGLAPLKFTDEQKEIFKAVGKSDSDYALYGEAIWDRKEIAKRLFNFGVKYEV